MKILITGASGSGTTTLGLALAETLAIESIDTDDLFWLPTTPPFTQRRNPIERHDQFLQLLITNESCVVSGSIMGWGEEVESAFDLIVFLYLECDLRITRLKAREEKRFGYANPEFLEWAAGYDSEPKEGRSLAKHRSWLAKFQDITLELAGDLTVEARAKCVIDELNRRSLMSTQVR